LAGGRVGGEVAVKRLVPAIAAVSAAVAACAAGGGAVPAVSGAAPAAGSWGRAIEVPGLGALNAGGGADVVPVSCASAGNCAAGGHYTDRYHIQQGFVASERQGRWGTAIEVPGLAALNVGGGAEVTSVSCAPAGGCAAGGYYTDGHHNPQGFVADERQGVWGMAIEVPGLAAVGWPGPQVVSVSCASAGNCAAGGYVSEPPNIVNPIIAAEGGGRWGKAAALPGDATPGDGEVNSVSCASAGNCLAGGGIAGYNEYTVTGDAFIVEERSGRWGPVRLIAGLRALEHYGDPESTGSGSWISSVACPSAGNCAAGGAYIDRSQRQYAFVAAERNGAWGPAVEVPGLAALNAAGGAEVTSVSCGAAGSCAAGGYYADGGLLGQTGPGKPQGFVAVENNGAWGTATGVPGLAALNAGGDAEVTSVSCAPAGSCAAGGYYADRSHHHQGFVAVERNGVWGTAIPVSGLGALNTGGNAEVTSVSCGPAGSCAAGGFYTGASGQHQGFVTQAG
jgi:hypothetical protein